MRQLRPTFVLLLLTAVLAWYSTRPPTPPPPTPEYSPGDLVALKDALPSSEVVVRGVVTEAGPEGADGLFSVVLGSGPSVVVACEGRPPGVRVGRVAAFRGRPRLTGGLVVLE